MSRQATTLLARDKKMDVELTLNAGAPVDREGLSP